MMKKYLLLFLVSCLLIAGCGSKALPEKVSQESESADSPATKEDAGSTGATPKDSGTKPAAKDEPSGSSGKQIADQTFPVTLSGWDDVTFASFMPMEYEEGDGDAQFKLLRDGKEVYEFPRISEDNHRFNQSFQSVLAVAFQDYNNDGKKDVIIINEYSPLSGPGTDKSYNEVRLYTQMGVGNEFFLDKSMEEYLMKNYYDDTIASVMEGIREYQQSPSLTPIFYNYFGDFSIIACRGTAAACAMSPGEIFAVFGKTLSYQEDACILDGNSIDIPDGGYSEEIYPTEQFVQDFKVAPDTLGITADELLLVTIPAGENSMGTYFFALNDNVLLICHDGAFFEADRISNTP